MYLYKVFNLQEHYMTPYEIPSCQELQHNLSLRKCCGVTKSSAVKILVVTSF